MEEKDLTLEKAQKLYDEGEYKSSYEISENLFTTEENKYQSLILLGKNWIHLWYDKKERTSESFLSGAESLLSIISPVVETTADILKISEEWFQVLGDVFLGKSALTSLVSLFSINRINGQAYYNACSTRISLKKEYFELSKIFCSLFYKLAEKPDNKIEKVLEEESVSAVVLCKCISDIFHNIQRKTIENECVANYATVENLYTDIKTSIEENKEMSVSDYGEHSLGFLACEEQLEQIISDEAFLEGRIIVDENADISFEKNDLTSTASREFYVNIVTDFLRSTTIVEGQEASFVSAENEREIRIEKIKKYVNEIKTINAEYIPPEWPAKEGKQYIAPSKQAQTIPERKTFSVQSPVNANASPNNKVVGKEKPHMLSIAGFAISIFSLLFNLFGLVGAAGAIVSAVALKRIKKSGEGGKILAYIGIIIGICSIIYGIIQTVNLL